MTPFEYVITLESFVYALALAHLLSGAGRLLLARERVRFSGLQTLVMVNAAVTVFVDWLSAWPERGATEWDFPDIAILFVYAMANYFLCAAATPEAVAGEPLDLRAFYWSHRRLFYVLYALLNAIGIVASRPLLKTSNPALFATYTLWALPYFLPSALAILVKAPWAQWVSGFGLLALSLGWGLVFTSALR